MEPVLVLSPHLDDAILSAGRFLSSYPGCYVLTVFAGRPDPPVVKPFDVHSGFHNSEDALTRRWDEDDRACAAVDASPLRLALLDQQYVDARPEGDVQAVIDGIAGAIESVSPTRVVAPLGLSHPDHVLVAQCAAAVALATGIELWTYEDIPSRVERPEEVPVALDVWRERGFNPVLGFIGAHPTNHPKRAAVACYESQLWALDQDCLFVPERFWRQWPTTSE